MPGGVVGEQVRRNAPAATQQLDGAGDVDQQDVLEFTDWQVTATGRR